MSKTDTTTSEATVADTTENDATTEATKFVVASQVKNLIRSRDFCVGGDLIEALSARVKQILETGIARAEANGRKTIRSSDI
jgi:hypothetical protein